MVRGSRAPTLDSAAEYLDRVNSVVNFVVVKLGRLLRVVKAMLMIPLLITLA